MAQVRQKDEYDDKEMRKADRQEIRDLRARKTEVKADRAEMREKREKAKANGN
jgi:hypothetical protein